MNQLVQPQEQIQAFAVQALWLQAVIATLSVVGVAIVVLPKIFKPAKEKEK